jgi:hypothetical protein
VALTGREEERHEPIVFLKIHVTATCNELLRDGLKPINGRDVERCGPTRALVVDEGLRAFCRQQPSNLPIFTMTRGRPKLLPQHFEEEKKQTSFFLIPALQATA